MKFGLHCEQGTSGDVTTPPSEHEHCTLAVMVHSLVWLRPALHVAQAAQGAKPVALQVEPATQGGAGTQASAPASQIKPKPHAHCV